jgi:hypothetical protein
MTITYTHPLEDGHTLIHRDAFTELADKMPETVVDVLSELALAGDVENWRVAVESGLSGHPLAQSGWAYTILPLLSKHPKDPDVKQLVRKWLQETGGDDQARLDKALLEEVDPARAREYLEAGARVGIANYFGRNAFHSAFDTRRTELLKTLVQFYNENNLYLPLNKEKGLMGLVLEQTKSTEWRDYFLDLLGPMDQICDEFRKDAATALLKRGMTKVEAGIHLELAKFARFDNSKDWDSVCRALSIFGKPGNGGPDITAKYHYPAIIDNLLVQGVEIDHIFPDMVKVVRNNSLTDFSGTLLMRAADANDPELVAYLLEKGANPRFYVDCYCAYDISEDRSRAREALDAFAAKQAIEKTMKRQKVAAILYGGAGKHLRP